MQIIFSIFFILLFLTSCKTSSSSQNTNTKSETTLAPLQKFNENTIDGVLVSIGDRVILLSDFQHAIAAASAGQSQISSNGKLFGGTLSSQQAEQILESLINQKVLEVKSQELGLDISEEQLTERISEFLKQQNLTEFDLNEQLKKTGKEMVDYRHEFKNEILKQELISRVISPLVTVTQDEVNNYYLQQTGSLKQVTAVTLRSLVINLPDNFNGNYLEYSTVKKVNKLISQKNDFIELVKSYSMASNAVDTLGILPKKSINELPPIIREKLLNLNINDVIGPFQIGRSVFFFQYLSSEFGSNNDLKTNYNSWKNKLLNIKFEERLTDYLKTERSILRINLRPFIISR